MTWPEGIAAVLGAVAAAMVALSQHGRNNDQPKEHPQP